MWKRRMGRVEGKRVGISKGRTQGMGRGWGGVNKGW